MNPTDALSDRQIWSRASAGGVQPAAIGTYTTPLIRKAGAVATVGTALAAQLVAVLDAAGFTGLRTEDRHPALADIPPETEDYEIFSAGYGEIHSARELLQLVQRCNRKFSPKEDRWQDGDRVVDPFRPGLIYAARSDHEFDLLTEKHLNAVRSAFRRCETLIVALAASEVCESIADGAVFPVWPGTVAGTFDPERHAFRTLTIEDTNTDLQAAVAELRTINPGMAIILMVSPEPMEMTAMPAHVAAESFYGKAILRVAMDLASYVPGVSYFPALEIVTAMGAAAFEADGRTLSGEAIRAVATAMLDASEGGTITMIVPERAAPPVEQDEVAEVEASTEETPKPKARGAKLDVVDEFSIAQESEARHRRPPKKAPKAPRVPKVREDPEQRREARQKARAEARASEGAAARQPRPARVPKVPRERKAEATVEATEPVEPAAGKVKPARQPNARKARAATAALGTGEAASTKPAARAPRKARARAPAPVEKPATAAGTRKPRKGVPANVAATPAAPQREKPEKTLEKRRANRARRQGELNIKS